MASKTDNSQSENGNGVGAVKTVPFAACLAVSVASLAVGILLGRLTMDGSDAARSEDVVANVEATTEVADSKELDSVVATYTYKGATKEVSVGDVLEQKALLHMDDSSGNAYVTPGADDILSCVRNQILLEEAKELKVDVTSDRAAAYARGVFGTDDYAAIALVNDTDEQNARQIVEDAVRIEALRERVIQEASNDASQDTKDAWQTYTNSLFDEVSTTIDTLRETPSIAQ